MLHVMQLVRALFVVGAAIACYALASRPTSTEVALRSRAAEVSAVAHTIDWDKQFKLPPTLCPIKENSPFGVAIVLGQALNPDGTAASVLVDRALTAKKLLSDGHVSHIIASGGDAAGTGTTEASKIREVLIDVGIPPDAIIIESQAVTTAENVWFGLRWLPKDTGTLYVVTSEFHMARSVYTFTEVLNYFYRLMEDHYAVERYPRLKVKQAPARTYCGKGSGGIVSTDAAAKNSMSLAQRCMDELKLLATEVPDALFGPPEQKVVMLIWPVSIDVTEDAANNENFEAAIAQAMHVVKRFCECTAEPVWPKGASVDERVSAEVFPTTFPEGLSKEDWVRVIQDCDPNFLPPRLLEELRAPVVPVSNVMPASINKHAKISVGGAGKTDVVLKVEAKLSTHH